MTSPEELRHAILAHFYERRGISQKAEVVARHLRREGIRCEAEEVEREADFLVGLGSLATDHDPLGSTRYFHITSKGTLDFERTNLS